jgi:3-methyladenine DNA glycosylase AlkC
MTTNSLPSAKIIEQMIDLRIQLEAIDQQIKELKPAFIEACEEQESDQIHHERALIYCKITNGTWIYPTNIIKQQEKLKQLKQDFHATHEPNAGREVSWVIKLR